jgi:phosphoenolpyruvate synthase/pyruvate phosphate dikinase
MMRGTEHTLVFVQQPADEDSEPTATGVSWEVRNQEHTDGKRDGLQHIFVVPVCSTFALDTASYHRFLEQSGALDQARALLAEGDLQTADGAIITRKKVQSCIIAAEVDSILNSYQIEA